ncbi:hypothetical protein BV25DRAFT_1946788 [Artomyces pyxidatus]|uniref:Uncharacterized protein n=1 Tax=Artomyces pyxidatus TaxID=48021 RepID=A0ACB8SF03_9AGAM|nr:hypothetical protein BV25DRAFT_1946788 [Artomyces pyxidatus]
MPRITVNPHTQQFPDYDDQEIQAMSIPGEDIPTTRQRLLAHWTSANTRLITAWDAQVAADQAAEELRDRQAADQAEAARAAAEAQAKTEREEAEKRRPKPGDYDSSVGIPDSLPIRPSQYAISRLKKFEYVELAYFTPYGCRTYGENTERSAGDDSLSIAVQSEGGVIFRPTSAARPAKDIPRDSDLSWDDMLLGATQLLVEMTDAGWGKKHVEDLKTFFSHLAGHPVRHRDNENGTKVLLRLQEYVRRNWISALAAGKAYNIAGWNENLFHSMSDEYERELGRNSVRR